MAQAFRRSRIASAAVLILSAVLAVVIWIRDRNYPVVVPIIASVLMLAIGWIAARVLGNLLGSMENTRYLGYLHMELDPDKFLSCYRDIPGRMKAGSAEAAICRSYLADGYAAKGEYAAALEVLSQAPPEGNLPVKGLYALGRASHSLSLGDIAGADTALAELDIVIDACRANKPDLAKNLSQSRDLQLQRRRCLTGQSVDTEWLENLFETAQYNLRRLEISKLLAMTALRDGKKAEAQKQLSYLRKNGQKTDYKRWADQQKL
ncbi:MAG: hypothetical protein ACI4PH_09815 [Faecousia sp.]